MALAAPGKLEGCFKRGWHFLLLSRLILFFSFRPLLFSFWRGSILPFRMLWSEPLSCLFQDTGYFLVTHST